VLENAPFVLEKNTSFLPETFSKLDSVLLKLNMPTSFHEDELASKILIVEP
jgi:hypothetical protein